MPGPGAGPTRSGQVGRHGVRLAHVAGRLAVEQRRHGPEVIDHEGGTEAEARALTTRASSDAQLLSAGLRRFGRTSRAITWSGKTAWSSRRPPSAATYSSSVDR